MYQTSEKQTVRIAEFSAHWEGRTVGGVYSLDQLVGAGENSAVFLTSHDGRPAALKLLHVELQKADAQIAQWRATSKLSHPNLIRIYNTGRCELDGLPLLYIVMEYADEALSQVLPQRALTPAEARDMLQPTLNALEYIHRQGFVHGHVKPANIMAINDNLKISSDGIFRGPNGGTTPGPYDPPERANGVVSAAGDVWSLGMTLAEVLTQRLPASGTGMKPPADLPEPFRTIVRHCLERNAKDRSTIREISKYLANPEGVAAPPPRGKRRIAPVGVVLLVALVVIIVVGVILRRPDTGVPVAAPATSSSPAPTKVQPPAVVPPSQPQPEPQKPEKAVKDQKPAPPPEPAAEPENPAAAGEPLTEDPGIPGQPMPTVTAQARRSIRGRVKVGVRVEVAPSGAVTDAKLDGPSSSKYFSDLVLKTVRQWKFEPMAINGSDAGQRWRVRFEFQKTGTKVQRQRLSP
jgi:TonB family protein